MEELNIKKSTSNITLLAILCALAIVISIFESMLPEFIFLPPGFKLGLSNIVTMFSSCSIGILPAVIVTLAKSVFVGVTRGAIAFFMSIGGGTLSALSTGLLLKYAFKKLGFIGISIIGALVHNLVQVLIAGIIMSEILLYYIPILVLFAIITGSLTGIILKIIMPILIKLNLR